MKTVLLLDNYDSFTFNLAQLLEMVDVDFDVVRNDKISIADAGAYRKILLSPGPGIPSEAGIMPELVKTYSESKPVFGVCLGHQCIAEVFGGKLLNMKVPMHGKSSLVEIIDQTDPLLHGLPRNFNAGRYHSWLVDKEGLPDCLAITACDEKGEIMAMRHKSLPIFGVQFHPESVMTEYGLQMIKNWLAV